MLVAALLVAGCGVQIGGGDEKRSTPDAAEQADASLDAAPNIDGDPLAAVFAACMAKGYTASGTLTSLYRASAMSRDWPSAQAECASDVAGATHLIVLSSTAESQYMQTKLGWVGLSDQATEGTMVNVTLEPNDQRPFLPGQPDDGGGEEDCVQMKAGGLDDDQCENAHVYVCECDGRPST
jgi:hypothetical protein